MIVLALVLLVLGVGACVVVAVQATDAVTVDVLGQTIDTSAREIFAAGVVAGLLVMAGLWLLKTWSVHARRRHREMKELKRGRSSELERLQAEKAELESRLRQQERSPERAAAPASQREERRTVDLTAQERRAAATGSGVAGDGPSPEESRVSGSGSTSI
ncbi:hypothetical protein CLV35_1816 [Motilibacter peucedani]|uniref:LapA family protein n=1 Tax=Motilibacter peucedani TaxID=598650 RepID=A0A420XQ30_9ACTN|nr:hypothetical protein [Motilibacter peucedani]RKS75354.1 hypothetical protein CLV35_1816 [Motilibacter peucedani]